MAIGASAIPVTQALVSMPESYSLLLARIKNCETSILQVLFHEIRLSLYILELKYNLWWIGQPVCGFFLDKPINVRQ